MMKIIIRDTVDALIPKAHYEKLEDKIINIASGMGFDAVVEDEVTGNSTTQQESLNGDEIDDILEKIEYRLRIDNGDMTEEEWKNKK
ncbi:MAG: hypothetical protein U9N73_10245 [Candidatus Auribacterota bacterium]|nr:hypothetical protein [Candidatus Auribacterota bacterium]